MIQSQPKWRPRVLIAATVLTVVAVVATSRSGSLLNRLAGTESAGSYASASQSGGKPLKAPLTVYPVLSQNVGSCIPAVVPSAREPDVGGRTPPSGTEFRGRRGSDHACYLLGEQSLSFDAAQDVSLIKEASGGEHVSLRLTADDAGRLRSFFAGAEGKSFAFVLKDRVLTAVTIGANVDTSTATITYSYAPQEARDVRDALSDDRLPAQPAS